MTREAPTLAKADETTDLRLLVRVYSDRLSGSAQRDSERVADRFAQREAAHAAAIRALPLQTGSDGHE